MVLLHNVMTRKISDEEVHKELGGIQLDFVIDFKYLYILPLFAVANNNVT